MKILMGCLLVLLSAAAPALAAGPQGAVEKIKVLVIDGAVQSEPGRGEVLTLVERTQGDLVVGGSEYAGDIEIWRGKNGLYVINELPLETYVEGVVKAETGKDWPAEALKAQAVVVRTYLYHQMKGRGDRDYDITSSVLHQLYKGLNTDPAVAAAVWDTEGEVLTYEGEPIVAYYHSTSGGKTEVPEAVFGASYPYLKSVEASCSTSPMNMWARRIPLSEVEQATGLKGIKEIKVASNTPTGRVGALEIVSNPETVKVEAKDLRRMLGWRRLPSTDFTFEVEGDTVVIEGRGYGHGVGMCQWTAMEMALAGKGYREILSYFYPGTALERHAPE